MDIVNTIKIGAIFFISGIGWFVGGYDSLMITLLLFMLADYITGTICGIAKKKLSSKVGFLGIAKKVVIILLVGITNLLGQSTGIEGLRYLVISFYLANEGISIIENASMLGLPVPKKVKDVLEQLKDQEKKESE